MNVRLFLENIYAAPRYTHPLPVRLDLHVDIVGDFKEPGKDLIFLNHIHIDNNNLISNMLMRP